MNADSNETELDPRALAISVWENEGGSQAPDTPDGQFGRRVEMDRSWTMALSCLDVRPLIKGYFSALRWSRVRSCSSAFFCGE